MNKHNLKNAEHKMEYLEKNRQLANNVSCIVEEVQWHLFNKLKLPFKDLNNSLSFAATDEENELETFAWYKKFVVCVRVKYLKEQQRELYKNQLQILVSIFTILLL